MRALPLLAALTAVTALSAQAPNAPDRVAVDQETMEHFQALLRFDTSDPPGGEKPAADYLKHALEKEGIAVQVFALEPNRPNIVARLKGNGRRRPLLIMAHTDVVNVDPKRWNFPPFSATRDGGYVYGRGTVDDKDNVVAALMTMLMLKRLNVALERDVIFLAEAGEEGTTRVGIQFMTDRHFPEIEAEFCFAEGGGITRVGGEVKYASVQTLEKIPRAIQLTSRGPAGHGSVPLETNAVSHLSDAVAKVAAWVPPIRLNETTASYFKRLASVSSGENAERYRAVLSPDLKVSGPADAYLRKNEPPLASMLRSSLSPTMFQAGYRVNVIPSEATATIDTRVHPDEDPEALLDQVRKLINDPSVEVSWSQRDTRPHGTSALGTDAFKVLEENVTEHYQTITLPTMSTGATDMAYLRARGVQCYGVGPAIDVEDGPKGFGAHSDQERILESELYRFVRFHYDIVADLARAK
jgi:acetylornithine deacetylase/succinyl-diaminopimelate desuccinylase-like protein